MVTRHECKCHYDWVVQAYAVPFCINPGWCQRSCLQVIPFKGCFKWVISWSVGFSPRKVISGLVILIIILCKWPQLWPWSIQAWIKGGIKVSLKACVGGPSRALWGHRRSSESLLPWSKFQQELSRENTRKTVVDLRDLSHTCGWLDPWLGGIGERIEKDEDICLMMLKRQQERWAGKIYLG